MKGTYLLFSKNLPIYYLVGIFAVNYVSTKNQIVRIGDKLIRDKGYNAFSFYDISKELGIKNASIHYHFATKTDLVLSIVRDHIGQVQQLIETNYHKAPLLKLNAFFSIYSDTKSENRICIVGSLATDLHTVDAIIKDELKTLTSIILIWVTKTLEEGKRAKVFSFKGKARTKALMIITNMLASLQLTRLTGDTDFKLIKQTIVKELKP